MELLTRKIIAVIVISFFSVCNLSAQLTDMGRLLSGGADDGAKLLEAYLAPFPKAFGASLNAGWYNTAKTHSFPGFDLSFSFNVAFVPDEAKFFDLDDLGLSYAAKIPSESITPTFSGPSGDSRPVLRYTETLNNQEIPLAEYTLPQGTGIGFIPAPTLQLGLGLPFGTDIIGRYTPEINLRDAGNMGLWGFGLKHSIDQWIPGLKRLPVLNLSLMAGYTKFYTTANVSFLPGNINAMDNTSPAVSWNDQKMDFGVGSLTANMVVSADIPFFTAYAGLGINSTTTNLKMSGWFPVPVINQEDPANMYPEVTDLSALKDPVDFSLGGDYKGAQPRATAGVKLKLSLIHIHFDYTWSNYSVVTGGLGISFR